MPLLKSYGGDPDTRLEPERYKSAGRALIAPRMHEGRGRLCGGYLHSTDCLVLSCIVTNNQIACLLISHTRPEPGDTADIPLSLSLSLSKDFYTNTQHSRYPATNNMADEVCTPPVSHVENTRMLITPPYYREPRPANSSSSPAAATTPNSSRRPLQTWPRPLPRAGRRLPTMSRAY